MISQCHGEEEGRQSDAPAGRRQHLQVNIDSLSGRAGGRRIEGDREREREREREVGGGGSGLSPLSNNPTGRFDSI